MKKGGRGKKPIGKARPRPSVVSDRLKKDTGGRIQYERVKRRDGNHSRVYTVRNKSQKLTSGNVARALKKMGALGKAEKGRRVQIVIQHDGRSIGTLKYTSASDLTSGRGWKVGFESWVANTRYQSFSAIQVRVLE